MLTSASPRRLRRLLVVATVGIVAVLLSLPATASARPGSSGARGSAGDRVAAAGRCPSVQVAKCHVRLSTGISMAYEAVGPRRGPAVILLHGLTDSSRSWSLAMQRLHEQRPDLRIYALDQRGQGDSSMPRGARCRKAPKTCFSMADLARDVVAFMHARGIHHVTLAGHSMGSFVAQEVALRHPHMVRRVVFIASSTTGVDNPTLRDYVLPQIVGPWRKALVKQGVSWPEGAYNKTPLDADPHAVQWMKTAWDADPVAPPRLVNAIAKDTAHVRLGTWLGETRALLAQDNTARLRHLRVPVLVLWGAQDPIFYRSPDQRGLIAALKSAARGPGSFSWKQYGTRPLPASGYQVDEIGHNIQWEAAGKVARDISAFMRTGHPTPDLYHTDYPADIHQILTVAGAATVISRR